ncbi:MAG: hypothetical protein WCD35_10955 [Mycobacteriales bacterium]
METPAGQPSKDEIPASMSDAVRTEQLATQLGARRSGRGLEANSAAFGDLASAIARRRRESSDGVDYKVIVVALLIPLVIIIAAIIAHS